MADKDVSGKEERILNVPLRREWLKVPRNERGKRAMNALREFVSRHTKSYDIRISQKVNESVWIRGIQKPPHSIRVKLRTDSDGVVHVMLPEEIARKPGKEKKGRLEKMKETLEKEKGLSLGGPKGEILKKGKRKESKEAVQEETQEESVPEDKEKPEPKKEEAKSEKKKEEKK